MTLDVYSHVLPHIQEEAANKMDALLTAPRVVADAAPKPTGTDVPDAFRRAFDGD